MDTMMTSSTPAPHPGLAVHWVPVTDTRGRTHLEMHWSGVDAPTPAPVGAHPHAA